MKHTKFKSAVLAGALSVALCGSAQVASANNVQGTDGGGVQISDFSGLQGSDIAAGLSLSVFNAGADGAGGLGVFAQDPRAFVLSFNSALGRYGVSVRNLLNLLGQNRISALDKTGARLSNGKWYYQANAQAVPGMAAAAPAGYDLTALSVAAERVNSSGMRLGELLGKLANDRKQVNPLLVGPNNDAARTFRSALSNFTKELQKVPVRNLTPEQLRAYNQVVDDTTLLAATLESVAPMLSDMSKRMNETVRR